MVIIYEVQAFDQNNWFAIIEEEWRVLLSKLIFFLMYEFLV